MAKLTISYSGCYSETKPTCMPGSNFERHISFEELKSWAKSGKVLLHLFRYSEVCLNAYDLKLISKPFLLSCILKALSRGKCTIVDREGIEKKVSFSYIAKLFLKMVRDLFQKKGFIRKVLSDAATLSAKPTIFELDLKKPPVYLRTDFCFGLQSGGSVGHIAGVLNHLHLFTAPPIFITSDRIPTVDAHVETHRISPEVRFWDFSEMPPIHFNPVFFEQACQIIKDRLPGFIYQRYSLNNFSGAKLAKKYRIPFVLEFNGSEIWVNKHWGNGLKLEKICEKIESANLHAAQLIVVVSRPLKDELVSKGIAEHKILVNPNGVNPDVYAPKVDGSSVRSKYGLENKCVLGFIGTFGRWHGVSVLIESYAQLLKKWPELKDKTTLLLVGSGMTMPDAQSQVLKHRLSENCIFTGTVPQNLGPTYLAASDILLSPQIPNSDNTPFFGSPTKIFEYMAMGKPIIASNLDQIGQVLEHGTSAELVKPGDIDDLTRAMKWLIDNPDLRRRLGQVAREHAISRHSWKEHTRKIIEALTDQCKKR